MKKKLITLLTMGRALDPAKDRTGVYKLPRGAVFPKFGFSGKRKAEPAPVTSAPASIVPVVSAAPVETPTLFDAPVATTSSAAPTVPAPVVKAVASPSRIQTMLARVWASVRKAGSWFRFGVRPSPFDSRPRAQAQLDLNQVTVVRNDLSEADVVVAVARPAEKLPTPAEGKSWSSVTARWIKLKNPVATTEPTPTPAPVVPVEPTKPGAELAKLQP